MTIGALLLVAGIGWWSLGRPRTLPIAPAARADGAAAGRTDVSVIIPARNEASSLPALLRSLGEQTHPAGQVVVADDESADATLALALEAGAEAFTVRPRPAGWVGKPWACAEGALVATGRLLVFLDADVRLAPDALARLVAAHDAQGGGLLSVQPHHRAERWWEQASALPNLVAVLASGALRRGGPRPPVAFGPCLVTDRASYERAGTHAAVAGEVIEDLALARAYDRAGLPVGAALGRDAVAYRMYPDGPGQLVEGWTKNLAGGPGYVPRTSLAAAVVWVLALSSIVGSLAAAFARGDLAPALPVWAVGAAVVTGMLRRIGSFRWWAGPAFPVLWLVFVGLFVRSAVHRSRGRVAWRGRLVSSTGT